MLNDIQWKRNCWTFISFNWLAPLWTTIPLIQSSSKFRVYTDKTIIPFLPSTPQWYPEDERWVCRFRKPLSRSVPEEHPSPVDDGALRPEVLWIQIRDSGTLAIYCQVVHFDSEGPQFFFDNLLICEVVFLVVKDSVLLPAKPVYKLYIGTCFVWFKHKCC